ncbi:MAG: hypothetical protein HOO99_06255 [Hyphomicrobiaceae bacterium]|nr:hypothetical protein [Hyphomicrobiaceae bacterium]
MSTPTNQGPLAEAREMIVNDVAAGYRTRDEIIESVREMWDEDENTADIAPPDFVAEVDAAIRAHIEHQKQWVGPTDCERLDAAFTELEVNGIVARQNFTCCQNCGFAEIGDEIDGARERGINVRGLTFFHQQDTESAVVGHGLHLAYAAIDDGTDAGPDEDAPAKAIAAEIVTTLQRHGLKPSWSGERSKRIELQLDWKRRFVVGDAPDSSPTSGGKRDLWAWLGLKRR